MNATDKLKDPRVSEHYYVDVINRFAALQHANDFSEQWQIFQDTVKESAEIVLGRRRGSRKKQWITQDTWDLIDERQKMKVLRDRARSEDTWQVCNTEYRKLDKEIEELQEGQENMDRRKGREAEDRGC